MLEKYRTHIAAGLLGGSITLDLQQRSTFASFASNVMQHPGNTDLWLGHWTETFHPAQVARTAFLSNPGGQGGYIKVELPAIPAYTSHTFTPFSSHELFAAGAAMVLAGGAIFLYMYKGRRKIGDPEGLERSKI